MKTLYLSLLINENATYIAHQISKLLESDNSYLQTQLEIQKRITDGRDRSICDLEYTIHKLESELKALREERDELTKFIKTPFDCPECGEKIAYGITDELKALFERFNSKPIP